MYRPRRRRLLPADRASAFEPLESRWMFCAAHAATFQWTIPNDATSLARERLRIARLDGVTPPATYAALTAPAATSDAVGLPILNSNPGAAVDIYLDFDGDNGAGGNQMVTPYDTNGDPGTFDAAEQAVVTQAWSMVSTYFAMFDVNVTTGTPTHPFAWCAIGNNVSGGYSYVGVFPQSLGGTPESYTSSSFAQNRASGIAHEVGHNFGLQHQGDFDALGKLVSEYSSGYDAGHGALMGVDYAQRVHKWIYGHPSNNVSTLQDDLAVISGRIAQIDNGDGYRTDDVGDTIATATTVAFNGLDQTHSGILERLDDADCFSFTSTGGRYLVTAGRDVESGVDIKLEVYDASNHLIAAEDPASSNDASIPTDLPAGTYYARVSSHGNYGDLGKYVLTVSPLPGGTSFDSDDIGNTLRRAGGASYNAAGGVWTLHGAGTDISQASDQFRYAYEPVHGDGSITAHVAGLLNGGTLAKAGLMIRESLGINARHATVDYRNDGLTELLSRASTGGNTSQLSSGSASSGIWLRLTRLGDLFTAERSADNSAWTTIGSVTIAMASDAYIGLALTSARDTTVADGTFDHVAITGAAGPASYADNGLAAPTNLALAPTPTGSGLTAAWDSVPGADAYAVERSSDGVTYRVISLQAATAYSDADLPGSYRYFYRVRALVGGDLSTGAGAAAVVSGVNRPSAVASVTTISLSSSIDIDWRDTTGETGYRLERSSDGFQSIQVIATLGANQTGYVNTGLPASTTYAYRVVALSPTGDALPSATAYEGTRLARVSGVRTTASTSNSLTVTWTDLNKSETGYRIERSSNQFTWSALTTVAGDVTRYTDVGLAAFSTYYYRVTAVTPYTEGLSPAICVGTTHVNPADPAQSLPAGWGSVDVGPVGGAGASGRNAGGAFSVVGTGSGTGATTDQFQFAYRQLSGDGELIARLDSLDTAYDNSETGLMFRTSLAANSAFAYAKVAAGGSSFADRAATGGTTNVGVPLDDQIPVWLKLTRTGDLVSAYRSGDGSSWSLLGSASIALGANVYVGLVVASTSVVDVAVATFSNVGGTAAGQPDTDPPATPTLAISDDTGASTTDGITRTATQILSGAAEPGSTLTLTRNGAAVTTLNVGYTGTWSFAVPTLADGTYTFAATATDASGNTSVAGTRVVTIDTTPPTVIAAAFEREAGNRWAVTFNEDVGPSLTASDFAIVDRATGASVTPSLSYDATAHVATLTLAGGTQLADGRYELRVAAGAVTDLAGNDSTVALASPFNVFAADFNDDGVVDFNDLLILAKNYGKTDQTFSNGNADYDASGTVNFSDLLILAHAYGKSLPAPAIADTMPLATRRRPSTFSAIAIAG